MPSVSFVPGYDWDVFISYAQVNNHEGWVSGFKLRLTEHLDERLGSTDSSKVFFDAEGGIPGNEPLTATIREAIEKTACLIIIQSSGYIESEWCRKEREQFIEAVGALNVPEGAFF